MSMATTPSAAPTWALMFAFTYQADFDLNLNGITGIDLSDEPIIIANFGRSSALIELSDRGNIVGWCG